MKCRPEASLLWPRVMYVGPEEVDICLETILLVYFAVWLEDFSLILLVDGFVWLSGLSKRNSFPFFGCLQRSFFVAHFCLQI